MTLGIILENADSALGEIGLNEAKNLTRKTPSATEVEKWIAQAKELPRVIEY